MLSPCSKGELKRSIELSSEKTQIVRDIIADVRRRGSKALIEYCARFDGIDPDSFSPIMNTEEIEKEAREPKDKELLASLTKALENIRQFHRQEKERSFLHHSSEGFSLGQSIVPLDRAAIYVPGGKAFYPSTLLMTAAPAIEAGVKEIIVLTPPKADGSLRSEIVYFAKLLGISKIVKSGGAQAIAYAAFGEEGFPPVDKIAGPGNSFVTIAKKEVFGYCGIDMLAGPSEICVVADKSARPAYLARDLITQAEHDEEAQCLLISDSAELIDEVNRLLSEYTANEERKGIIEAALKSGGRSILLSDIDEAFDVVNAYAPEHLEFITAHSETEVIRRVRAAGSLFIGEFSPEPLGDYFIGSNHVLPTYGSARFFSPLGVYDFCRRVNVISASAAYLKGVSADVRRMAEYEGLFAHAKACDERSK